MTATVTAALAPLRARKGQRRTPGLDDATLERLAAALMHAPSEAALAAGESGRAQDYLTALPMVLGPIDSLGAPAPRAGGVR